MLLPLLLACAPRVPPSEPTPAPAPAVLEFRPASRPATAEGQVLATAFVGEQEVPFGWHVLLREGDTVGGPPFGTVPDAAGSPLKVNGAMTCDGPDYNGLFDAFGHTWLFTHMECSPAALQRSRLTREGEGLRVLESAPLAATVPEGLNQLCAGMVTPWGSLLSGEEYESDVAVLESGVKPRAFGERGERPYQERGNHAAVTRYAGLPGLSPYHWGWMVETRLLDADGRTETVKHPAMGRFSHELGLVMPDRRTVYLTDDYTHGILAMFVADRPEDLSAGTLYAARWTASEGGFSLVWVSLGHATDAEIAQALASGVTFASLFERAPLQGGACPEGLHPHRNPQSVDECLRPRPGQEKLASRLETRRVAGLLGATTEIHKEEGLALDVAGRRLFVATTRIGSGMLAGDPPFPGRDHVALEPNDCGVVWSLEMAEGQADTSGQPIDSAWVARAATIAVAGRPEGETCAEGAISEPDNLAWIPGAEVLLIAEDTGRSPDRLWAWQDGRLLPIFGSPVFPDGSSPELSGLSWVPDAAGAGWITLSLQHPAQGPAVVGVLGPFPVAGARDE